MKETSRHMLQQPWLLSDQAFECDHLGNHAHGERIGYPMFAPIKQHGWKKTYMLVNCHNFIITGSVQAYIERDLQPSTVVKAYNHRPDSVDRPYLLAPRRR